MLHDIRKYFRRKFFDIVLADDIQSMIRADGHSSDHFADQGAGPQDLLQGSGVLSWYVHGCQEFVALLCAISQYCKCSNGRELPLENVSNENLASNTWVILRKSMRKVSLTKLFFMSEDPLYQRSLYRIYPLSVNGSATPLVALYVPYEPMPYRARDGRPQR